MCHIPSSLTIDELKYVELLIEIDPYITTIELLALIQERREDDIKDTSLSKRNYYVKT